MPSITPHTGSQLDSHSTHRNLLSRFRWPALVALFLLAQCLAPTGSLAHANLDETDPPVDGLVVSSPEHITMSFTEDVATNPAPEVTLLDQQGDAIPSDQVTVSPGETTRDLVISIPDLDRGTWTVSWTVTSATDGHTLSGSWAFRVGGGLPPGVATSEDASPPPWAVALRWLSFLGAAVAAGVLLFPWFTTRQRDDETDATTADTPGLQPPWLWLVFGASVVALVAALLEPVGAWIADNSTSLGAHYRALPDDWIWRPATLTPFAIVVLIAAIMRKPVSRTVASIAAVLPLASLFGLILTSHAAGREDLRFLAVTSDAIHQWSVALWTGGLVALGVWAYRRARGSEIDAVNIVRFSQTMLVLVVIAVVTGVVNTGFMLPILENIQDDGLSLDAFSDLWSSRYGIVLLIKVIALIAPIALAAYHRNAISRLAKAAASAVSTLPQRMSATLRWEIVAVFIVVIGGSALALSSPPVTSSETDLDRVTLVAPTSLDPEDGSFLAHLTLDPASADENTLSIRLTDWNGNPLPADPEPRITLGFLSLDHGTANGGVALEPDPENPGSYTTSGLNLSIEGWWQITATISRSGQQNATATFNVLLPDPNTQGSEASPRPESSSEAEALYNQALSQMLSWERVRWVELLGSGQDVLVIGDFAVIDGTDPEPDAHSLAITYSGSFAPTSSGQPPAAPSFNSRHSITVGESAWLQTAGGDWLDENPTRFVVPAGWGDQYEGATNFSLGTTQEVDGRTLQLVTFYLPPQTSQSEAFFAWWIDVDTGDVIHIAMIARMHYMNWTYTDINGDFVIEPPVETGS